MADISKVQVGGVEYDVKDATARESLRQLSEANPTVELDNTLTQSGKAADAKAVGDALASKLNAVMVSPDGSKWRVTISNEGLLTSEKIIIEVPATGIVLSANALTFNSSANQTINATLTPADSTDVVVWETSNPDVATVSNGVVTPVGNGSCTITATAGSVSASCDITVDVAMVETYTITRNITNATGFDDSAVIGAGSELLECYISNDECTMDGATATVTMGGVDITETAWDNGVVNIAEVTGDVVITLDAVKIQYVVPPIEDFTVQLHDGSYLLKEYTGVEAAIELPTTAVIDGATRTLKLYGMTLSSGSPVKHIKVPADMQVWSQTSMNNIAIGGSKVQTVTNLSASVGVSGINGSTATNGAPAFEKYIKQGSYAYTSIRTLQGATYSDSKTDLTSYYQGCTSLVDGGVIPEQVTNLYRTFYGCNNLRRVRIEGREFTNINQWCYGVGELELTCHIDSTIFRSMRYNSGLNWTFKDIDGGTVNKALCFGDSLSEATYEEDMVSLCPENAIVYSLGNGGYTSEQIYQKMVNGTYDERLKDSIIVIWHGTNGYGTDGYEGVTAKMVAALEGNQRYVLIPPTAQGEGDEVYESWKATYGQEHVLSMGDWFANNGYTVADYLTDAVHFTDEGYALVAQAVHEKIQHWL